MQQLKSVLPEIFSENQIDFEKFQQLFGDQIATSPDRYGLNWAGKSAAYQTLQSPTFKTLTPCVGESVNFDTTQNLFIEGENLDVLKALQKSYFNSVKMIYIDPPYNTGNDFVYNDSFAQSKAEYAEAVGDLDEQGKLKKAFVKNSKENGHYHSNWLNMMLPRLHLARNLLKDDGVIFISIDDNEQAQLKLLCDEVFGEENFVNAIAINMKNIAGASGGGEDKRLKKNVEILLIYVKSYESFNGFENVYEYREISELVEEYKQTGKSWKYTSVLVDKGNANYICSTVDGEGNEIKIYSRKGYQINSVSELSKLENLPEKEIYKKYATKIFQTAMPQSSIRSRVMKAVSELSIENDFFSIEYIPRSGRNKGILYEQFYKGDNFRLLAWLKDVSEEINGELYKKEMQGTFWDFVSETKNLTKEGNIPFPNGKKPVALLKRLLEMQDDKNCLVLDFFCGSGTTAHSVMKLNYEDNGKRRYICVQIPEILDPDDKDQKLAYELCNELNKPTNIAEISKERIRRAGKQISEQHKEIDTGFKVFKLTDSHFKQWQQPTKENLADQLEMFVEPLKKDAGPQAVLYEILLRLGLKLTAKVRWENGVFWVEEENITVALLLTDLQAVNFDEIFAKCPQKVVALDSLFANNDALKKNTELQMNDAGIAFVVI
ncbi:site-specific DNA-methyltransferase [Pasteurella bettyae]|uniref:site-specific DNA-methyltransferase n=1 Tax=Pasteurella bettyae TaxID=752 RepID=UPI00058C1773|nr:site-specific DNA-methyltransferase [Pasteurella bettyae]